MKKTLSLVAVLGAVLTGCVSPTPNFVALFGQTVRTLSAQQALRPQATLDNRDRVPEGMEGRAARETIERYQRSFEAAPPQNQTYMIGAQGAGQFAR